MSINPQATGMKGKTRIQLFSDLALCMGDTEAILGFHSILRYNQPSFISNLIAI